MTLCYCTVCAGVYMEGTTVCAVPQCTGTIEPMPRDPRGIIMTCEYCNKSIIREDNTTCTTCPYCNKVNEH